MKASDEVNIYEEHGLPSVFVYHNKQASNMAAAVQKIISDVTSTFYGQLGLILVDL